ncbi:calmin-like, partial [Brachionichthys hirsutus]|uniref:calmin-like n=1 Tax=Brachionichthys hirsutus TaxID=412623 RepID=UPI003604BA87
EREVVQKRTFTRWMNLHLQKCDPPVQVQDLFCDIQDGRVLMALLEGLSGCKLLHGFKKSSHRIFRLNNIAKVLSFLEERNVKLVSIDAADVADGNSSIILGLIWNIILFFQIKELTGNIRSQFPSSSSLSSIPTGADSDASFCRSAPNEQPSASTAMREHSKAIKKLLQWVQKRTRKFGVAVQDFGKSWVSGLALLAVIKSIDPTLVDMRKALLRPARENLEDAFRIAHYSLGIPQLLEPEDITTNAPDEQSIMTYVSQFLKHFPDIEERALPCQPMKRSISTCRLDLRDSRSNHIRNDGRGSIVKERSYMFQRDGAKPPPKILISSVSEDRGTASSPFRPAATRSWSSEDILTDSSRTESIACKVEKEPKEAASPVYSPEHCGSLSPTSGSAAESVNSESVVGDSAISSPESWVESRSDSLLCDSGTTWDVYRAIPVEITSLDEGFVPSMEDRAPDGRPTADSYVDEGIYSPSSLESTRETVEKNPAKGKVQATVDSLAKHSEDRRLNREPDPSAAETTGGVDAQQTETIVIQKDNQDETVNRVLSKGTLSGSSQGDATDTSDEVELTNQLHGLPDKPDDSLKGSFQSTFDHDSPKDDCAEPMDLFYPDKEEPVLLRLPDADTQSWPSVLSVSALQPAPASEALPDGSPRFTLDDEVRAGLDLRRENDQVNVSSFSHTVTRQVEHNSLLKP